MMPIGPPGERRNPDPIQPNHLTLIMMNNGVNMSKYDYSKYPTDEPWPQATFEMEFWGLHQVNGRIEVDVKRYAEACEQTGIKEFLPDELFKKPTVEYYVPSTKNRYDYTRNFFYDKISHLIGTWNEEYKPVFRKIKTPAEVESNVRLNMIAVTSDMEDIDDIDVEARMAGVMRIPSYHRIINEMYCMFLMKVCSEIDRIILFAVSSLGYTDEQFDMREFKIFSEGKNGSVKIWNLKHYKEFDKLHKINNFLKHNSVKSFSSLDKYFPECIAKHDGIEYANGMYAGDWLNFQESDIDSMLKSVLIFLEDYCRRILGENIDRCYWDNDDYFLDAFKEMRNPMDYFGVP